MTLAIQIGQLILMLIILVMLHEWGHFYAARKFGVRVERFFCFFDVKFAIWKKKIGDTVYGIGWLPLGGYVKLAGMIDESMDTEQMNLPPKDYEFRVKPAWQRLIIMLGGIIVNMILAMLIYFAIFFFHGKNYTDISSMKHGIAVDSLQTAMGLADGDIPIAVDGNEFHNLDELTMELVFGGEKLTVKRFDQKIDIPVTNDHRSIILAQRKYFFNPRFSFTVEQVKSGSAAEKAGLEADDEIVSVNSEEVLYFDDFKEILQENANQTIDLELNRNGQIFKTTAKVDSLGTLGFMPKPDTNYLNSLTKKQSFGFFQAIGQSLYQPFDVIVQQIKGIKTLTKVKGGSKQIAGPIGLVQQMPKEFDWIKFANITALFSAWLAFINLLPIPGLDGGHALFCLYEIISGKKPGDKFLEKAQMVGVFILLTLMVFIFGNDIWNLISK